MSKSKKPVKVTRKFLLDLADMIHDPKTKEFTRLCEGVLINGPDPTNKKRRMHCGLGELYFAMTHKHPEEVVESDVVRLAAERSTFVQEAGEAKALGEINKLKLPDAAKEELYNTLRDYIDSAKNEGDENGIHNFMAKEEAKFREILSKIPEKNDDDCPDDSCTVKRWRSRSARVANEFRKAAKLLPK